MDATNANKLINLGGDMNTRYSISIIDIDPKHEMRFLRNIRILTGISLKLAVYVYKTPKPIIIFDGLDESMAAHIMKRLEMSGCKISVGTSNSNNEMFVYFPDLQIRETRYIGAWLFSILKRGLSKIQKWM